MVIKPKTEALELAQEVVSQVISNALGDLCAQVERAIIDPSPQRARQYDHSREKE